MHPPGGSIASSHRRRKHCQQPQASAKTRKALKNMKGMQAMKHIDSARKIIKGFQKMLRAQAAPLTTSTCLNNCKGIRLMRYQWLRWEEKKAEKANARDEFMGFYAGVAW